MKALTKNLRRRAAIVIAVAYAFCVLAPTAALAVVVSPTVFHCIGALDAKSDAKQVSETRQHADGSAHHPEQSAPDDSKIQLGGVPDHHSGQDKSDTGNCCGVFCVSAIAHDPGMTFGQSEPASAAPSGVVTGLIGRAPGPLHRPPIT